jgi:hypothetical protein
VRGFPILREEGARAAKNFRLILFERELFNAAASERCHCEGDCPAVASFRQANILCDFSRVTLTTGSLLAQACYGPNPQAECRFLYEFCTDTNKLCDGTH